MKYFAFFFALCCLVSGCAGPQPLPVTQTHTASSDEQRLWRRALEEQNAINSSGVLYEDTGIEHYLNRISKKLHMNSISSDISFNVKVINDPSLNAFAFPNGVIYVHSGILARMDNEAQLAALLAHEMAHCIQRHSLRVLRSTQARPKSDDSLRQTPAGMTTSRELGRLFGLRVSMATLSGYTRELEIEADRLGLDLVVKANYDPREGLKLFELLKREIEREGVKESYFFKTHPNVQQRMDNLNRWLAEKYPEKITGMKNTDLFRSKISRLMLDNARLDIRQGRFFVAQKTVEKYLATKPRDAQAYYLLGEIFRQWGRHDDAAAALDYYEKAISLNPSFPEPLKAMGLIHLKDGEKRLAKKFFETCLLLSPNAADKAYIEGYLKLCANKGEG